MATADAIIIGGGVMGCSILYNLANRGLTDILLLEKDVLASGSTSKSQAILRMHYSNEVTTELAWKSLELFKNFADITGVSSGFKKTGYFLIVDQQDRQALENNVAMQKKIGVDTDIVTSDVVKNIAPMLSTKDSEFYAFEPQSGYADPYSVTTGYANAARALGAEIQQGTLVTGIAIKDNQVRGVLTNDGLIEAPIVVVAAGPWSCYLLKSVGIEIGLQAVRHQVIMIRRPTDLVPDHPIIGDVVHDLSARPDAGHLTLVGVGEEDHANPNTYDQGVDMPVVEKTFASLVQRIPGMSQALFRGGWSGLFTTTPDWHPVLDQVDDIDGLYCAVGFSGHGFKLSPMIGQVMAELITGESTSVDISMLDLNRFKEGQLMTSRYRMQVLG